MNADQRNEINEGGLSVLITGGSGLIGRYLTSELLSQGYRVSHLSRQADNVGNVRVFRWDPAKGYLDAEVFDGINYLIHLSGANIGEKRWTAVRKEEIVKSRVSSVRLLYKIVSENNIKLKAYISASAVGYYGSVTSDKIFSEEDLPAGDFLGNTCRLWEEGADLFADMGIRTIRIRTAVVLEKSDSALSKLMEPARYGLVVRLGDGKQYFPWIHIDDLCKIYLKALKDSRMTGAYNAVAPEHINHDDFVKTMARVMHKPVFLPKVPAWIIELMMGEMSEIVLKGSRISCQKIIDTGFRFRFPYLEDALRNAIRG